eukprot:TRINITY_DN14478_c0_g1_i1.p1 TRINITY_DN14478_c0_g1~~TRINITY_DN14478_c0_g1_i1.p1  ORF type:complete len:323 (+),score=59.67 TRINITY_DN14478_c0_g1_i1:85-1053(+)
MEPELVPLVARDPECGAAAPHSGSRRPGPRAAAAALGLVALAGWGLHAAGGLHGGRAAGYQRQMSTWPVLTRPPVPHFATEFCENMTAKWNAGDMDGVLALYSPRMIFFDKPYKGMMNKTSFAKLIKEAAAAGQWKNMKLTPLQVLRTGKVAHMIASLETSTPGTVPQAYVRLEEEGRRWVITEDMACWGAESTGFPARTRAPDWMRKLFKTWSSLWFAVSTQEYVSEVWFPDAVVYDRYVGDTFLGTSELVSAIDAYSTQPGQHGPGSATWGALDVVVSSPTVAHVIGTNMQTPDVPPWYARLENRGGDWRIAAEVVSIGH